MNNRNAERQDMLAERELRIETQMHEMCSQIQPMSSGLQKIRPLGDTVREL